MLELYQAEECPHSSDVRTRLSELGVSYLTHNPRSVEGDVRNETSYGELTESGADQIPYLVDTAREETIYETDDIIEYLDHHYE